MRDGSHRLRFTFVATMTSLLVALLFSLDAAHAVVRYGQNTVRSGFGYTFTGNTVLNLTSSTARGGVRLIVDKAIYWDSPLIECELYWFRNSWELIARRALEPAIGSGTAWSAETGAINCSGATLMAQGEVICYNPTYTSRVQFWPSSVSGGNLGLRSIDSSNALPPRLDGSYQYSINESGQTFGSKVYERQLGYAPDLVLARGDNGHSGYIYSEEMEQLDSYALSNRQIPDSEKTITLYQSDGITPIDTFTIV